MALHPDFPDSPHAILTPGVRWFPADEALRETSMEKLMPPLVAQLRKKVKEFRDSGYVGATDTSKSLLNWWFKERHLLPRTDGSMAPFAYYFAQRESLETIVYLYDVAGARDKYDLMRFDAGGTVSAGLFDENWRRYVVKMATGSGKTKVMSLVLAWSFFHKLYEPDSELSRNFLLITPNIIVLDRIYKDFQGLRIFFKDPVLPDNGFNGRNWRDDFQLTLHKQDEVNVTRPTGNIFLTNIHRIYSGEDIPPSPDDENSMDYFLGKRPTGATTDSKVDLGMIVRDIDELMILNDEAHHIHDARLAWFKSIEDIHNRLLQKGGVLSLQVDVTATPKHNNGAIFVQTVADYPLVEAIWQNVVKHPVLPDTASRTKLREQQSAKFTERYADYLDLGVIEWRKAYAEHEKLGKRAILFVMTDDTKNCDEVAEHLENRYPELAGAVLTIHTKNNGEVSEAQSGKKKDELERLRKQANDIDDDKSPYKAIVSVIMLKEGWDVRNVTTIVGLRAYSAKSNILPEQTLGRGLRLKTVMEILKKALNELTVRDKGDAEIKDSINLRRTRPFMVNDQGYLVPKKSVFNRAIGDSRFELEFADFPERCDDVVSWAKNYFAVHFKLDYVNADGDISNYYPDFIVKLTDGRVMIVETKGQEDLDVPHKMARLAQWCDDMNAVVSGTEYKFVFAGDGEFEKYRPGSFFELLELHRKYKPG